MRTRVITVEDLKRIVSALDPNIAADCSLATQFIIAFFLVLRTEDHTNGKMLWKNIKVQQEGSIEFLLRLGKSNRSFRVVAMAARTNCLDLLSWPLDGQPTTHVHDAESLCVCDTLSLTNRGGGARHFRISIRGALQDPRQVRPWRADPTLYAGYSLHRGGVTAILSALKPVPAIVRHVSWTESLNTINKYWCDLGYDTQRLATAGL